MCDFFDLVKKLKCLAIPSLPLGFFSEFTYIIERLIKQEPVSTGNTTGYALSAMEKSGNFIQEDGELKFASALTRSVFISRYYTASKEISYSINRRNDYTIQDLVVQAVKKISSQRVCNNLSINRKGERYETFYRFEFYRNMIPLLGFLGIKECNPDVGKVFGVVGNLDFYLHYWGIEVVRDNSMVGEHFVRFHPELGIYGKIPMRRWVVLHFLILSKKDILEGRMEQETSKTETATSGKEPTEVKQSIETKKSREALLPEIRNNEIQVMISEESINKKAKKTKKPAGNVEIFIRMKVDGVESWEDTHFDF
jgi:hypothetical protein